MSQIAACKELFIYERRMPLTGWFRFGVIMLTRLICTDFTAILKAICWAVQMVMQGKNVVDTDPMENLGCQNHAY